MSVPRDASFYPPKIKLGVNQISRQEIVGDDIFYLFLITVHKKEDNEAGIRA